MSPEEAKSIWSAKYRHQGAVVSFDMKFDPADPFDEKFRTRSFAECLTIAMRQVLCPGDVFIDVGAQKGYVTLHAAALVGNEGRVLSFEPDRRAADLLTANCDLNGFRNVEVFAFALGEAHEERFFQFSNQLGWSSFYPNDRNAHTFQGGAIVKVHCLDDVLSRELGPDGLARLRFVKIDCEGSEPEVLRGMRSTLGSVSPPLWIEVNTGSLRAAGSSEEVLLDLLAELGYSAAAALLQRDDQGVPFLGLLPYRADPSDHSHRVFDVIALPRNLTSLPPGMFFVAAFSGTNTYSQ